MERLDIPWLCLGPCGSGKLSQLRKWIEAAHNDVLKLPLEVRNFTIGDGYEAKVLTSPYHFEIDIPNLSMQDKQIIGELLTMFFSSGDVLSGLRTSTRKLVILRRAHSLSLAAAIRVRSILQQFILPPEASGMLWITAREMTGPLALLEDAFVQYRIPRMSFEAWAVQPDIPANLLTRNAYDHLEGRPERIQGILKFFPDGGITTFPRRIQDFYDEMLGMILQHAQTGAAPNLNIITWVRARVYQALSLCQTGQDIIDSFAAALERKNKELSPDVFWKCMTALTKIEPHTSYRTPLSLEYGILSLYETIRQNTKKTDSVRNEYVVTDESAVQKCAAAAAEAAEAAAAPIESAIAAVAKTVVKRRTAPRKK